MSTYIIYEFLDKHGRCIMSSQSGRDADTIRKSPAFEAALALKGVTEDICSPDTKHAVDVRRAFQKVHSIKIFDTAGASAPVPVTEAITCFDDLAAEFESAGRNDKSQQVKEMRDTLRDILTEPLPPQKNRAIELYKKVAGFFKPSAMS